jgi:hypothetical protein
MERFAQRVIRGSNALHGLAAVLLLFAIAVKGYWALFFPFLLVVGLWAWWIRTHSREAL